jgi:hypothetical protein
MVSALVYVYIREAVCPPLDKKNPRPNHTHDVPTKTLLYLQFFLNHETDGTVMLVTKPFKL